MTPSRLGCFLLLVGAASGACVRPRPSGALPAAVADFPYMPPSCAQCPTGQCKRSTEEWCGGTPPPPGFEESQKKGFWVCEPPRPRGCPQLPPSHGETCQEEQLECRYGDCPHDRATCVHGVWNVPGSPI